MHPLIEQLQRRRRAIGATQARVASVAGLTQPQIARLEGGAPFVIRTYDRYLSALQELERAARRAGEERPTDVAAE